MATPKRREARVTLRIVRANSTSQVMRGITSDAQKATKQAQKDQERIAKQAVKAAEKAARDSVKADERAEKAKVKEAQKTADQRIKEAKRTAAQELRIQEQTIRSRQRVVLGWMRQESREHARAWRERERIEKRATAAKTKAGERSDSMYTGMAGGALAAGIAAITAAVNKIGTFTSQSRDRLGIARVEDQILNTKQVREDFTRSMTAAGKSAPERAAAFDVLTRAGAAQGVMPDQMLDAANMAQETFSDSDFVINNADFIAQLSRATGAASADLVRSMLTNKQKFGLSDVETVDVTRRQYSQTAEGAIEFKQLAGAFAPTMAMFRDAFGNKGGGAQNAVIAGAVAQTMARALKSPDEAATLMERLVIGLTDTEVQGKLKKRGIDIADKNGALMSPTEVFGELFSPENMPKLTPAALQEIFGNILSVQGMQTFLTEMRTSPERYQRLTESTGASGQSEIEKMLTALRDLPTEQINEMQVNAANVALTSDGVIQLYIDGARMDVEAEKEARERLGDAADVMGMKGTGTSTALSIWDTVAAALSSSPGAQADAFAAEEAANQKNGTGGYTMFGSGKVGDSEVPPWLQSLAKMIGMEVKGSSTVDVTVRAESGTQVVGTERRGNAATMPGVTTGQRGGG